MKNAMLKIIFGTLLTLQLSNACAQPIDSLLYQLTLGNPELKSLYLKYEAETAKAESIQRLQDPTVGVGVPILNPETRLGPQVLMINASQMFPWFGSYGAKKDVLISMSKTEYEKYTAVKLELYYQLKKAYYRLHFINERINLIEEKRDLYNSLESVAIAKVESGDALTSDVLRIQMMEEQLDYLVRQLQNNSTANLITINRLINQNWDNQIVTDNALNKSKIIVFDTTQFRSKITNHHPMLNALNNKIEASENQQEALGKMYAPKIGFGLDYSMVNPRIDAMPPPGNGQDILIPKVSLSIPIYRKPYKALNKREDLLQESYEFEKLDVVDKLMDQLLHYKLDFDNAILEIELYDKQISKNIKVLEILLVNYSVTGKGFDEILQLESQQLQFELNKMSALQTMHIATAQIERLTDF